MSEVRGETKVGLLMPVILQRKSVITSFWATVFPSFTTLLVYDQKNIKILTSQFICVLRGVICKGTRYKATQSLGSALFCDITRRRVVIVYRRFGTMYGSHFHGSRVFPTRTRPVKMGPIRCHETSVKNYHTTPRNIPEERRSHQHRGGSLNSRHRAS